MGEPDVDEKKIVWPLDPYESMFGYSIAYEDEFAETPLAKPHSLLSSMRNVIGIHSKINGGGFDRSDTSVDWARLRLYAHYVVFRELQHTNINERIDKVASKPLFENLVDVMDSNKYIAEIGNSIYKAEYARNLKAKHVAEYEMKMERVLRDLVTGDMKTFVSLLNDEIPEVSHPYFGRLLCTLLEAEKEVPQRQDKLSLILCGCVVRNDGGTLVRTDTTWNNGNSYRGAMAKFKKFFERSQWNNLWKLRGIHRYREGLRNRHGYGNDNPSWWALGYQSLEDMQAALRV